MKKFLLVIAISCAIESVSFAQVRFDAASIRPTTDRRDESMVVNPGGLIYSRVSLRGYIEAAYGLKYYQISGPDWIDSQLFDISARSEGNHSKDEIMLMLQSLLADRFKLALHREQKELPVYALVVGKNGPKLRASDSEGDGLRLEAQRAMIDMLVVDHAERTPTEN